MKIRFSNLGTIRETELDLRPLTVIIGPNNSSKTYLAYSVYGLLREMKNVGVEVLERLRSVRVDIEHGYFEWSLRRLEDAFQAHVEASCRSFEGELDNFFQDSSRKIFRQAKFHVDFEGGFLRNMGSAGTILDVVDRQARLDVAVGLMQEIWPHLVAKKGRGKLHKLSSSDAGEFLGGLMRALITGSSRCRLSCQPNAMR